jgi:hypothetical protein
MIAIFNIFYALCWVLIMFFPKHLLILQMINGVKLYLYMIKEKITSIKIE